MLWLSCYEFSVFLRSAYGEEGFVKRDANGVVWLSRTSPSGAEYSYFGTRCFALFLLAALILVDWCVHRHALAKYCRRLVKVEEIIPVVGLADQKSASQIT